MIGCSLFLLLFFVKQGKVSFPAGGFGPHQYRGMFL